MFQCLSAYGLTLQANTEHERVWLIKADQNFSSDYFVLIACNFIQKELNKGNVLKMRPLVFNFEAIY